MAPKECTVKIKIDKKRVTGMFDAFDIAIKSHDGQLDKAGKPYVLHPIAVADACKGHNDRIVALLHDVVEDTPVTLEELSKTFKPEIVEAIDAISRRDKEPYKEYISRCKENGIAARVKALDIQHNLSRIDNIYDNKTRDRLKKKYSTALEILDN